MGKLDEDVFMKQPEGFVAPGEENLVCHLKKEHLWAKAISSLLECYTRWLPKRNGFCPDN